MTLLNTLLEITIYSAVLFGAIWLFRIMLKKQLSPVMLYAVWFILIARLLVPVTITSGISFFTVPTQKHPTAYSDSVDLTGMLSDTAEPIQNTPYNDIQTIQHQEALNEQLGHHATVQTNQASITNSKLNITWQMALVTLWLAGIAVMLIQIVLSVLQLKKRIKTAQTVPTQWQSIARQLQTELNLKRRVSIVMIEGFPSPALCGGIKPVIVLPSEMAGKSEESIRFALLHEMTHIKRGDNIVCMLLLLLRAVYWFNPVIWLMMKQMRLDIETACDSCLTKPMTTSTKKRYAGTMLSMYAQQQIRYVLGMALGQTKKTAERRLRGMFMRSRSSLKGKMIAILLTTVLLVTCFTTACQPTPEEPVVVAKGEFEDIIAQQQEEQNQSDSVDEVIYEPYEALDNWVETLDMKGSKIKANVDATVYVPDVGAYPVYEVIQNNFTQQHADRLLDYFVQDKDIIKTPGMVKADYEEMLIEAKRGQLIDGEYVVNESSLAWVEEVEKMIQNAPETSEPQIITDRSIDGDGFGGAVNLGNGKYGSVYASHRAFNYTNGGYPAPESQYIDQHGKQIKGEIAISEDEAVKVAMMMLDDLEVKGMVPVDIEKAAFFPRHSLKWDDPMEENMESKGYFIKFALSIDGIDTVLIEGGSFSKNDTFDYCAPWIPEWVHIYVDESGSVQYFDWHGPLKLTEKVTANTPLKPFEEIQEKIRDQIFYKCGFYEEREEEITVTVERIEMKMTIVGVKNKPDKAMYVPAWYIHYVVIRKCDFINEHGERVTERPSEELLVLNAIDGGVVIPFRVSSNIIDAENAALAEDAIDAAMKGE